MSGYIGVDFDGTLATHAPGSGLTPLGEPIPRMVERVKAWLAEGREVRIITARVAPHYIDADEQAELVRAWCREHLGQELVVQSHKCGSMYELWDDRAIGVIRNEGIRADEYNLAVHRLAAQCELKAYDREHGVESDASASLEVEQLREHPRWPAKLNLHCICVNPMAGELDDEFYVTPREARVLAAQLLRAADEADAAIAAEPGAELRQR